MHWLHDPTFQELTASIFRPLICFKLMLKCYGRMKWVGYIGWLDGVRPITAMKGNVWEKHCSRSTGAKTSKDSPFFWAHQ